MEADNKETEDVFDMEQFNAYSTKLAEKVEKALGLVTDLSEVKEITKRYDEDHAKVLLIVATLACASKRAGTLMTEEEFMYMVMKECHINVMTVIDMAAGLTTSLIASQSHEACDCSKCATADTCEVKKAKEKQPN